MNQIKKGILLGYLYMIVNIGIGIIKVPIYIGIIGKSQYGLYQLVFSILNYALIFETSLSTAVMKYFVHYKAKNDICRMENTLAIARSIFRYLYLFLTGFAVLIVFLFQHFYQQSLPPAQIETGKTLILLVFLNISITIASSIDVTIITSDERFSFIKLSLLFGEVLQFALTVVLTKIFPYAETLVLSIIIINALLALSRHFYARKLTTIRPKQHYKDPMLKKQIVYFGITILFTLVASQIFWNADQIILAKFFNADTVAVYSIGALITNIYMRIGLEVFTVFYPKLGRINLEEDKLEKFSDLFVLVGRICFLILYPILVGFLCFGNEFIYLWIGPGYEEAYFVAVCVMIPMTIDVIEHLALNILQIIDKYRFRSAMFFLAAVLNIILTVVLVQKWGMIGAALATGIAILFVSVIIMNIYYQKIGFAVGCLFSHMLEIMLKTLPIILLAVLLNRWMPVFSPLSFLSKGILFVLLYGFLVLRLLLSEQEKDSLRQWLRKMKPL